METTNPYDKQQHLDRIKRAYFDEQSKRNIFPLSTRQNEMYDANSTRLDPTLVQTLHRDLRHEIEEEFIRYCEERIQEFEIDTIDEFLSKSMDELTVLFNDSTVMAHDDDEMGMLFDPDIEALAANSDGTGKTTRKHFTELFQLLSDAAIGRFNERFYYFYAYLTHWVDQKKAAYLDNDFFFCIDVNRLKEIANESMLQAKLRYILETYLEAGISSNSFTCRLDITNPELQMRMLRSVQKSLSSGMNDFTVLDEIRTMLVKDKLVNYYAGFKAYLFRMNLSKTHPSRLARLQEQLNLYQQQQRTKKSAKTTTRSSASTMTKKTSERKASATSKQHHSAPVLPIDMTTVTKTQHLLNERMKTFDQIQPNHVYELRFPNPKSKSADHRTIANKKARPYNQFEGHATRSDRLNSEKEKIRGPISVQYSLTSGLKVKFSDGRGAGEGSPNDSGIGTHQDNVAYSFGNGTD